MPTRFHAADAHWRIPPASGASPAQKDWLTRDGSLTAHLRTLGAFTVRIIDERVDRAWPDECTPMQAAPRAPMWVREVVLHVDGVPCVAAHSIAPLAASLGIWQAMRRLRTRPLAELLYSDSSVSRSTLVSRRVTARHPLYALAARADDAPHALLARRSVFARHGAPLMVTECMLPGLWALIDARAARGDDPAVMRPATREHRGALLHTASLVQRSLRAAHQVHHAHHAHEAHETHQAQPDDPTGASR